MVELRNCLLLVPEMFASLSSLEMNAFKDEKSVIE